LVELLISAGANPNIRDGDGDCPLHVCEVPEVAEYLLMNGADPSLINTAGETIFDKVVEDDNEEMIKYWTDKGLDTRGTGADRVASDEGDMPTFHIDQINESDIPEGEGCEEMPTFHMRQIDECDIPPPDDMDEDADDVDVP
jgi:hypothetical protein